MKSKVLIVEDRSREREALARLLRIEGYSVATAGGNDQALTKTADDVALVICDVRLGSDDGVELLKQWKAKKPSTPFVMVTAFGEVASAVTAMKHGALEYLLKPVNPEELLMIVRRAVSPARSDPSSLNSHSDDGWMGMVGSSAAMKAMRASVRRIAHVDSLALILGESGCGKELVARAIHQFGTRCNGPFVTVNVAAVPETLVEAELFGTTKGAFTGADSDRIGKVEASAGGTLFIDEIGDFPLSAQPKLLRVLEDSTVMSVGSNQPKKFDVRFVAATSRNLEAMVAEGKFREDLYYRLNVLTIKLPPLRERGNDIAELVDFFVSEFQQKHNRPEVQLAQALRQFLMGFSWPGNVREMRNAVEHMIVMCDASTITLDHLPEYLRRHAPLVQVDEAAGNRLDSIERAAVLEAISQHGGNRTHAAAALGISVRTLQRKLKQWGVLPDDGNN